MSGRDPRASPPPSLPVSLSHNHRPPFPLPPLLPHPWQHVNATGALNKKAAWTSMDAFGAVLAVFVAADPTAAATSLFEFQTFFQEVGFPKGVLEATFHRLYENDVVPTEAFIAWKDRVDDTTAKGTALIQLARCVCARASRGFEWRAPPPPPPHPRPAPRRVPFAGAVSFPLCRPWGIENCPCGFPCCVYGTPPPFSFAASVQVV